MDPWLLALLGGVGVAIASSILPPTSALPSALDSAGNSLSDTLASPSASGGGDLSSVEFPTTTTSGGTPGGNVPPPRNYPAVGPGIGAAASAIGPVGSIIPVTPYQSPQGVVTGVTPSGQPVYTFGGGGQIAVGNIHPVTGAIYY